MDRTMGHQCEGSAIAGFPSGDDREAFLGQVRLWNGVEGLAQVRVAPLHDGTQVQVRTITSAQRGIARLIEATGGRVLEDFDPLKGRPAEPSRGHRVGELPPASQAVES